MDSISALPVKESHADVSIGTDTLSSFPMQHLYCTADRSFIGLAAADNENRFCAFEAFHFPKPLNDAQLASKISSLKQHNVLMSAEAFKHVSIQTVSPGYTLVPFALFKPDDVRLYYELTNSKQEGAEIRYDVMKSADLVNVFIVPALLASAVKAAFGNVPIHHHCTALLESCRLAGSNGVHETIFLHFHSGYMDIVVMRDRKLRLCNTFSYRYAEDAVYYLLFVCEQLMLRTADAETIVMGEVEENSPLAHLLYKYMANVSFGNRIKTAKFTDDFDILPSHFYYTVFSPILCES